MISGTYRLHSRHERVINYASENGRILSLVEPSIGHGPGHVILSPLPDPAPAQVSVNSERIQCGAMTIRFSQLPTYNPRLAPALPAPADVERKAEMLVPLFPRGSLAFLLDASRESEFDTDFGKACCEAAKRGARHIDEGRYEEVARALKGLGPGLTPSGDDFLCGLLWAFSLAAPRFDDQRDRIYKMALGDNLIVNHFLHAAHEGLFFERFKNFTRALCEGSREETREAFHPLLAFGATSGADTATGLILGLRHARQRGA